MPENKKKTRGNLAVMGRLVGLVKPLTPVMVAHAIPENRQLLESDRNI